MDNMFDNSNNEVFTGKLVVAIVGRVVEAGAEEDEPEGVEAIKMDQCSNTMKTSLKSINSITKTLRRETEKRKGKKRTKKRS